jgi:hypothetical protein
MRIGDLVLVGWGKLGPGKNPSTGNTFVARVIGWTDGGRRVILESVRSGKLFTMVSGGPWFRGWAS